MVCVYVLCFHSSISGHLGSFYFSAIANSAAYEDIHNSNSCLELFWEYTHFILFEHKLHSQKYILHQTL